MPAAASGGVRADTPATVTSLAGTPARSGSPTSTVDRVADFYGAYIDVLFDSGRGRLANSLRGHYLTEQLRSSLARWEAAHHRDGVLRAKGVPIAWKVVYNDSGMGHCWTRVTLTWQDTGNQVHRTHLMVQSDLATRLISGIKAA
ncbi:hypothetical protein EJ357_43700 [Streptomyces cyaneochromogenes]|uniref:Nuclear transport factor 2 family protein n=2 Tax=Streptomyces cyaneochromogenes TaxID=2496836 RepID=A0A3Q9EWT3_9ACTN|nr:hypothetical protein EJ357_43700 [Streptomyces cyaneochromogenes]